MIDLRGSKSVVGCAGGGRGAKGPGWRASANVVPLGQV